MASSSSSEGAQQQALLNLLLSLANDENQDAGSTLALRQSSSLPDKPELKIDFDHLPMDISRGYAQNCQKNVREVGHAWFSKGDDIAIEFVLAPDDATELDKTRRIFCDSQVALEEALQEIDPETMLVLIIVHSHISKKMEKKAAKPRCTLRAMLAICEHFKILPTFAPTLEGQPCLWSHLLPAAETEFGDSSCVLGYKAAFPWFSSDSELKHELMQITLFGTACYTLISAKGLPNVTIFSNLATSMVEPVREKWQESLRLATLNTRSVLLPHYTMIGLGLLELLSSVKFQEFMQGTLIEQRFEIHAQTQSGNVRTTIYQSKEYLKELVFYRCAINALCRLIHGLDEEVENLVAPGFTATASKHEGKGFILEKQIEKWKRNLLRQTEMCESRIKDLIEIQRANESLMLSFMAQRDSASQAKNTAQMATLARATEVSGREINEMTRRMELDAKNMRFLAEITAFFLPLTAIATFFSMDFVGITSGPGLIPKMTNLKYIWVYVAVLAATSGMAFGWWYYKYHTSIKVATNEDDTSTDAIETRMETQAKVEESRRKGYAKKKFEEAKAEWDEHKSAEARGETVPVNTPIIVKLVTAQQAMETGQDFDELMAAAAKHM